MKDFFAKLTSKIIWVNLLLMCVVVLAMAIGVWIWLGRYTMHGQEATVPNVRGMSVYEAKRLIEREGLVPLVADSGYNKAMPSGTVLEQTPAKGSKVKPGREILLTINTTRIPTIQLPDIADNSSLREAQARLAALGIRLSPCEYVDGEKDWVYGVKYRGRNVFGGDRIPIDSELTLQVGSGSFDDDEELEADSMMAGSGDEALTDY